MWVGNKRRQKLNNRQGQGQSLSHLRVNAIRVVDGTIMLDDADAGCASPHKVTARVEAHVTEALDDERLATPAWGCAYG